VKKNAGRARWLAAALGLLALVLMPALALAAPRSGGSFGGRQGFRSNGGGFSSGGGYSNGGGYSSGGYGRSYGGGSNFVFLPSWGGGWGYGGYGGGLGLFGTLVVFAVAGFAVMSVVRAVRRGGGGTPMWSSGGSYDGPQVEPDRAYLYRLQLALGRSGRGVQERLAAFAEQGDTGSEAGLAALLQQSALELLREQDAVKYVGADGRGPMSFTNAETTMNSLALAERARFQVERVRAGDGRVNKSTLAAEEGKEALELVVVTLVVATRTPLSAFKEVGSPEELQALLSELGGVSPDGLLGLEVIWTPADPNDSMTETDVMTTYPELRGL
jgi:uncharacterized membrane protein